MSRGKLCCGDCKKYKVEQSFVERYGSHSVGGAFYEKAQKSKIAKYGSCYNFADPLFREKFEQAIGFVTSNMGGIESVLDKNYIEILDTFLDKLKILSNDVASKSIFDEHFKLS